MTIFRKLEDQKFPEGAIISIECELSRHNVDVKWMKASCPLSHVSGHVFLPLLGSIWSSDSCVSCDMLTLCLRAVSLPQNGVEVKPSKDLRIYAMGRKRFLQVMKCHVADSGEYACDAGDVTTSCTVEVYGKICSGNVTNQGCWRDLQLIIIIIMII